MVNQLRSVQRRVSDLDELEVISVTDITIDEELESLWMTVAERASLEDLGQLEILRVEQFYNIPPRRAEIANELVVLHHEDLEALELTPEFGVIGSNLYLKLVFRNLLAEHLEGLNVRITPPPGVSGKGLAYSLGNLEPRRKVVLDTRIIHGQTTGIYQ